MLFDTTTRLTRVLAFLGGIALVPVLLASLRTAPSAGTLVADVSITAAPGGELAVTPATPFLNAKRLTVGSSANGHFTMRNQTGSTLAVRAVARPSRPDLDHVLLARVTARGRRVFDGSLKRLRDGSLPVHLNAGDARAVRVQVRLRPGADERYAEPVEVSLELVARAVGSRS